MEYDVPPGTDARDKFMIMLHDRISALEKRESDRYIVRDVMTIRAEDADFIAFATNRQTVALEIYEAMQQGRSYHIVDITTWCAKSYREQTVNLQERGFRVTNANMEASFEGASLTVGKVMIVSWRDGIAMPSRFNNLKLVYV
jgi:hypothetical protein